MSLFLQLSFRESEEIHVLLRQKESYFRNHNGKSFFNAKAKNQTHVFVETLEGHNLFGFLAFTFLAHAVIRRTELDYVLVYTITG